MLKKNILFAFLAIAVLLNSCSSDDNGGESGETDNFDRAALLTNITDNIIIPAFENLEDEIEILESRTSDFVTDPTTSTLEELRAAWYASYKAWQHVSMFEIGKAEELQFVNHFNIYPLTESDVEDNVVSGDYDLDHPNNHDAQGFPALDYLIYGIAGTDAEIVDVFVSNANASGYKTYLSDVVAKMKTVVTEIVTDWSTYRSTFVSDTSNTSASSFNKLVNDFIFYYEKRLRANKIGIPAGNFSDTTLPEKVEALYKQEISKELAQEALTAVQNMFEGRAFGGTTTGESFKTYLQDLGNTELVTSITDQLSIAESQIDELDANFYNQVMSDNSKMTMAYDELQRVVVYLKVDMLQAFNVSVDYVDADGD